MRLESQVHAAAIDRAFDRGSLRSKLEAWREVLQDHWSPATAYPKTSPQSFKKSVSAGQCAVTSILLINRLPDLTRLEPRIALGQVRYADTGAVAIDYHGWIEVGKQENPLIIDLTADQAARCDERVVLTKQSDAHKIQLQYSRQKYLSREKARNQEVWDRYIRLSQKLTRSQLTHPLPGIQTQLDLTEVTDGDVKKYLFEKLSIASRSEDKLILSAALRCADKYSFSDTRTFPRPDHPDLNKRRSPLYTLIAIVTSLRTTLEIEQRVVSDLISAYPDEHSLLAAKRGDLERILRPAGMAVQKAKTILNAIEFLESKHSLDWSFFHSEPLPIARDELLRIKGLGPKSVDCLLTVGLGRASIAVDVNVFRAISRLCGLRWADKPDYADKAQVLAVKIILDRVVGSDSMLAQVLHTLFLLHGKHVCKSTCKNSESPTQDICVHCSDCYAKQPWQKGLF